MKLLPQLSYFLKIRFACSAGVSGLTNLFSGENNTVKCVSEPNIQTGCCGDLRNDPTSMYLNVSNSVKKPTAFCLSIPFNSVEIKKF